jgi:hypothetical protein
MLRLRKVCNTNTKWHDLHPESGKGLRSLLASRGLRHGWASGLCARLGLHGLAQASLSLLQVTQISQKLTLFYYYFSEVTNNTAPFSIHPSINCILYKLPKYQEKEKRVHLIKMTFSIDFLSKVPFTGWKLFYFPSFLVQYRSEGWCSDFFYLANENILHMYSFFTACQRFAFIACCTAVSMPICLLI